MSAGTNIHVETVPANSSPLYYTMKIMKYLLFACLLINISCNKDNNKSEYPRTFTFHHSTIIDEQGFVFEENEAYIIIHPRAGTLDSLRFNITRDLYSHIRNQMFGYYIESFTLLNKDSIQIKAWEDGLSITYTLPAYVDNPTGGIINKIDFGTVILYDKANGELKFCIALALGIFERNGNPYYDLDYELCLAPNVPGELQNFISYNDYKKNDTLGVYMLEMAYKE